YGRFQVLETLLVGWRISRPRSCRMQAESTESHESDRARLQCHNPPDTAILAPFTYDAASDVRNITVEATSSGLPARCMGERFAPISSFPGRCISVAIGPGETAFTRMPSAPTSRARPLVRLSMPPFEAAYHTNSSGDP